MVPPRVASFSLVVNVSGFVLTVTSCRFPYGASILTFSEARALMRRARDARVPPIPLNLHSMDSTLRNPLWRAWTLAHATRDERFYFRLLTTGGDTMLFRSAYGCSRVVPDQEVQLFIGFLLARPRNPLAIQSLTVGLFEDVGDGRMRVSLVID